MDNQFACKLTFQSACTSAVRLHGQQQRQLPPICLQGVVHMQTRLPGVVCPPCSASLGALSWSASWTCCCSRCCCCFCCCCCCCFRFCRGCLLPPICLQGVDSCKPAYLDFVPAGPVDIPAYILGKAVEGEFRTDDKKGNNYVRLRVRCSKLAHGPCGCSLAFSKIPTELGPRAAERYFGAWLAASHNPAMTVAQHRRTWRPTLGDIKAWLKANPRPP